jgi:hypothetical protein
MADAPAPPAATTAARGELVVECSDRLASLEVTDSTGHILQVGTGRLDVTDLAPGFYCARLRSPEGEVVEELVEVRSGHHEPVELEAAPETPSRLVAQMIHAGVVDERPDHTLEASELVGPMASPHLATILTLAGAFAIQGVVAGPGERLRKLGLQAMQRVDLTEAAVYVLAGADLKDPSEASRLVQQIELRVWPIGKPVDSQTLHLEPLAEFPGLGELALPVPSGPHWLSLTFPGEEPLVLAITPLPDRVAFVVLQRKPDGRLGIHQYLPKPTDPSSSPDFLRKLEQMQRIYQGGRFELGRESAQELLDGKWSDPIAGCLGGYLMLKLGNATALEQAAGNMVQAYPSLSDSHVLQAECYASHGDNALAEEAAKKALDAGLPIFAEGIAHLLDYPAAFGMNQPNARLAAHVLDGCVKGSLWSLWSPPELAPGRLLVP